MLELYCKAVSYMKSEDGVTAIEYGLIAALLAITIIAGVTLAGQQLLALFNRVGTEIQTALGA